MRKSFLALTFWLSATAQARADVPPVYYMAVYGATIVAPIAFVVGLVALGIWLARKRGGRHSDVDEKSGSDEDRAPRADH